MKTHKGLEHTFVVVRRLFEENANAHWNRPRITIDRYEQPKVNGSAIELHERILDPVDCHDVAELSMALNHALGSTYEPFGKSLTVALGSDIPQHL